MAKGGTGGKGSGGAGSGGKGGGQSKGASGSGGWPSTHQGMKSGGGRSNAPPKPK